MKKTIFFEAISLEWTGVSWPCHLKVQKQNTVTSRVPRSHLLDRTAGCVKGGTSKKRGWSLLGRERSRKGISRSKKHRAEALIHSPLLPRMNRNEVFGGLEMHKEKTVKTQIGLSEHGCQQWKQKTILLLVSRPSGHCSLELVFSLHREHLFIASFLGRCSQGTLSSTVEWSTQGPQYGTLRASL